MKAFPNPPDAVLKVGAAVMCLMPPGGKIPRPAQRDWKACKANMGNVDQFLRECRRRRSGREDRHSSLLFFSNRGVENLRQRKHSRRHETRSESLPRRSRLRSGKDSNEISRCGRSLRLGHQHHHVSLITLLYCFYMAKESNCRFYEVYCEVEPKRLALEKANAELKAARDKLEVVNRQVAVSGRGGGKCARVDSLLWL